MDDSRIKRGIQEIKRIKRYDSERELYTRIIDGVIKMGDRYGFTEETLKELQDALKSLGIKPYQEWEAEKRKAGEPVLELDVYEGISVGSIETAVAFLNQFFYDVDAADFGLAKMNNVWTEEWLRSSKRQLDLDRYYEHKREDLEDELAQITAEVKE